MAASSARSGRSAASASPTSESAPSSTTASRPAQCRAIISRVTAGSPRSPVSWAAVMSSHSVPHPAREVASTTSRGSRSSRSCPPRAAVGRLVGRQPSGRTARSTPTMGAIPALRQAFANRTAP